MIFGDVDVYLREMLDKGWQNGGKMVANWWQTPDLPTLFVFYTTYSCETEGQNTTKENKKGLLYYEYNVFCTENRVIHREQSF